MVKAQQGDQEAFARLVEAYQVPVYNLAYRMLGTASEAEDATQETFLRVYTRLKTYDPSYKLSSWILSIASHYCVDRLRRRRGTVSMEEAESWRWMADETLPPEDKTLQQERDRSIRQVLAMLPEQYRLVIILRYWHNLSYEEIAQMTDSTESAVKSRLHRARQAVLEGLNNEGETFAQRREAASPETEGRAPIRTAVRRPRREPL